MADLVCIAGNIYLWFFLSAFFFAFVLKSLSAMIVKLFRKDRLWSRHLPAFYIFSALAIAVITLSVFFVDWNSVSWSYRMILFYLFSALFWFLIIRFPIFPGLLLLVISAGAVFYLNHSVSSLCSIGSDPRAAYIRMLSDTPDERTFELTDCLGDTEFLKTGKKNVQLSFKVLEVPAYLFFIPGRVYISGNRAEEAGNRLIEWISDKTSVLKIRKESYMLPPLLLLRQYVLSFDNRSGEFKLKLAD